MIRTKIYLLVILAIWAFSDAYSKNHANHSEHIKLFSIERSRNADEVIYAINIDANGLFRSEDPMESYWIKNSENGQKESLTRIQRKHGYGLEIIKLSNTSISFSIKAIPDRHFEVHKTKDENYCAYTSSNDTQMKVKSIYIKFIDGTIWLPEIEKININMIHPKTQQLITQILQE